MRLLFVIALLVSTSCLAAGPESQEFMGISRDGNTLTIIKFSSDGADWTGDNWIFSSTSNQKFRYCWINEIPIDPSNPKFSARQSTHFVCTSKNGDKPVVFYKRGHYYSEKDGNFLSKKDRALYYEAMSHFKNARKAGYKRRIEALNDYYVCNEGCDTTMPLFIFEVGYND